jgi:SAM-dependent methyltransferase
MPIPEDAWVVETWDRKIHLARLIRNAPADVPFDRAPDLLRLLTDKDIDPENISPAGWHLLERHGDLFTSDDPALFAARLEQNELALSLLREDYIKSLPLERRFTALRRWLLLSGQADAFPHTVAALTRQAQLNFGAWLFDEQERAALDTGTKLAPLYHPRLPGAREATAGSDRVTRQVAEMYENWPFPPWTRANPSRRTTLAADVARFDPGGPDTIGDTPQILIAGCGTGRQVAITRQRYPNARITAIDISGESLTYARERCAGFANVTFQQMDLMNVAALERSFDAVFSAGVLHHMADPEAGLGALVDVTKPGGVLHLMLYSTLARMPVPAMRGRLRDLENQPVTTDLLREVRRRLMAMPNPPTASVGFYTLPGIYDLAMHTHEDPFDVPRIRRALERYALQLLHFRLRPVETRARYHAAYPHDPLQRDYQAWAAFERTDPRMFASMYDFWCRKPA